MRKLRALIALEASGSGVPQTADNKQIEAEKKQGQIKKKITVNGRKR